MANRIQLRRGTAAHWAAVNPVLSSGEVGVDTTENKFKVGNGVTTWSALPYASGEVDEASVLAALGDTPELQGIKLADTSALILPDGVLGLDSAGLIVRHNGSTMGGVRIYQDSPSRVRASPVITPTPSALSYHEVGQVPVSAAQAVAGKLLVISGTLAGLTARAGQEAYLRVAFDSASNIETGMFVTLGSTGQVNRYDLSFHAPITVAGGVLNIPDIVSNSVRFHKTAATLGEVSSSYVGDVDVIVPNFNGAVGVDQFLTIGFLIDAASNASPLPILPILDVEIRII